jgi:hypothetical protein
MDLYLFKNCPVIVTIVKNSKLSAVGSSPSVENRTYGNALKKSRFSRSSEIKFLKALGRPQQLHSTASMTTITDSTSTLVASKNTMTAVTAFYNSPASSTTSNKEKNLIA